MFRTHGRPSMVDGHVDMSFRETQNWLSFNEDAKNFAFIDEGSRALVFNLILIGDEAVGPGIFVTAAAPGLEIPKEMRAVAHAHGCDNWRISLLGDFHMGPEEYGPGEYRLQEGWRVYPEDDQSYGPDGGWQVVFMADRRGLKRRLAVEPPQGVVYPEELVAPKIAEKFEFNCDLVSDDPAMTAGPTAIASTIGPPGHAKLRMGKLNGSFADSDKWSAVAPATRMAVTLLGNKDKGPVLVFVHTEASEVAAPRSRVPTELYRLVVEGSCRIGGKIYEKGDMRIQEAGMWCEPVEALEGGLKELLIFGDRNGLEAIETTGEGWPRALPAVVAELGRALDLRTQPKSLPVS